MKRVLLVNPNTCRQPYPVPPLGLCLAAAVLEKRYEVRIHDALDEQGPGLERILEDFAPDAVGLGIRNIDDVVMEGGTYFVDDIRERFAKPIRRVTRAPLILGGSGFTLFPHELLRELDADYGVLGEAETVFPALLEALGSGRDPRTIPGVAGRAGEAPRGGRAWVPAESLPFADIDRRIEYRPYRQRGAYPIQTKRGCAHDCLYCSYPELEGRAFRARPPGLVADEIEQAMDRLGDVTIELVDSTFNDPSDHAEAICREIVRRGLRPRLRTMGINPGRVTDELLDLMKRAGFAQIDLTPDSASPGMLKSLRKNFARPQLEQTAERLRRFDLPAMWFFLLGGPGENERTLDETFDFIDRFVSPDDLVHLTEGLRIYPCSGLYEQARREGVVQPGESLLRPKFYVSAALGPAGLKEGVVRRAATRPHCLRAAEATPPPELLAAAARLREEQGLTEPMFRTLLRLRRAQHLNPGTEVLSDRH